MRLTRRAGDTWAWGWQTSKAQKRQLEDQLHATRLGMALLLFQLRDVLRSQFPKQHALHEQQWAFDDFVRAAGAEVELDTLREQAKSQKQKDQEKKQ